MVIGDLDFKVDIKIDFRGVIRDFKVDIKIDFRGSSGSGSTLKSLFSWL